MPTEALYIRIDCIPPTATAQQKGAFVTPGGRIQFFKRRRVLEAERTLAALLAPYRPHAPVTGPVRLVVEWTFPYRKSERKADVREGRELRHTTRPDLDNLEKGLVDTMTTLGFWLDDSQICSKTTRKFRGPKPGICIEVRPL